MYTKDIYINTQGISMNLNELCLKYGTDKSNNGHGYVKYYEKYFEPIRNENLNILELGVREGWSVSVWSEYFKNSNIVGLDNDLEKLCPDEFHIDRFTFYKGSQEDELFLNDIHKQCGDFDIIIDDASHISKYTIKSFQILRHFLKSGGIYVIEDLHVCELPIYNPDGYSVYQFIRDLDKSMYRFIDLYDNKICFIGSL